MNPPTATAPASVLGRVPARDRLALALDVPDRDVAMALVERFGADFGVMKVGLELFLAEGPGVVRDIVSAGSRVFLDLKLHDIPNTVEHAARCAGELGVWLLTLHTQGGPDMLAAGASGLSDGAADANPSAEVPIALGVTVLTSDADAPSEVLTSRARLAEQAGCGGVVCAAPDLPVVTNTVPGMLRVVPGIRPAGAPSADQRRVATPASALAAGADVLVIGRAVTAAPDPDAAAAAIVAEVAAALGSP
ncbi:MAG: orotidine-5'-phosphate decarboxylase [Acidimicrobiales bacterium]|nr:orotidine-5'-phosphate decarboxylase [Acidimicrobiales bacterium]MXY01945.1 orotidine-5'-phosphate decarboxylase [Acidimicrobiales bacterium]MYG88761.1 orotidine-5'-phosphate decarboxylase [Acidimicrobiales bacterium]MYI10271.1 orotidine-5'-phosphate decarboxylase [Acidimicrobiales bacterium]MYI28137.1 orotidine-5'-phosphate decarboxylase [Acidimicrobiales bacterium]